MRSYWFDVYAFSAAFSWVFRSLLTPYHFPICLTLAILTLIGGSVSGGFVLAASFFVSFFSALFRCIKTAVHFLALCALALTFKTIWGTIWFIFYAPQVPEGDGPEWVYRKIPEFPQRLTLWQPTLGEMGQEVVLLFTWLVHGFFIPPKTPPSRGELWVPGEWHEGTGPSAFVKAFLQAYHEKIIEERRKCEEDMRKRSEFQEALLEKCRLKKQREREAEEAKKNISRFEREFYAQQRREYEARYGKIGPGDKRTPEEIADENIQAKWDETEYVPRRQRVRRPVYRPRRASPDPPVDRDPAEDSLATEKKPSDAIVSVQETKDPAKKEDSSKEIDEPCTTNGPVKVEGDATKNPAEQEVADLEKTQSDVTVFVSGAEGPIVNGEENSTNETGVEDKVVKTVKETAEKSKKDTCHTPEPTGRHFRPRATFILEDDEIRLTENEAYQGELPEPEPQETEPLPADLVQETENAAALTRDHQTSADLLKRMDETVDLYGDKASLEVDGEGKTAPESFSVVPGHNNFLSSSKLIVHPVVTAAIHRLNVHTPGGRQRGLEERKSKVALIKRKNLMRSTNQKQLVLYNENKLAAHDENQLISSDDNQIVLYDAYQPVEHTENQLIPYAENHTIAQIQKTQPIVSSSTVKNQSNTKRGNRDRIERKTTVRVGDRSNAAKSERKARPKLAPNKIPAAEKEIALSVKPSRRTPDPTKHYRQHEPDGPKLGNYNLLLPDRVKSVLAGISGNEKAVKSYVASPITPSPGCDKDFSYREREPIGPKLGSYDVVQRDQVKHTPALESGHGKVDYVASSIASAPVPKPNESPSKRLKSILLQELEKIDVEQGMAEKEWQQLAEETKTALEKKERVEKESAWTLHQLGQGKQAIPERLKSILLGELERSKTEQDVAEKEWQQLAEATKRALEKKESLVEESTWIRRQLGQGGQTQTVQTTPVTQAPICAVKTQQSESIPTIIIVHSANKKADHFEKKNESPITVSTVIPAPETETTPDLPLASADALSAEIPDSKSSISSAIDISTSSTTNDPKSALAVENTEAKEPKEPENVHFAAPISETLIHSPEPENELSASTSDNLDTEQSGPSEIFIPPTDIKPPSEPIVTSSPGTSPEADQEVALEVPDAKCINVTEPEQVSEPVPTIEIDDEEFEDVPVGIPPRTSISDENQESYDINPDVKDISITTTEETTGSVPTMETKFEDIDEEEEVPLIVTNRPAPAQGASPEITSNTLRTHDTAITLSTETSSLIPDMGTKIETVEKEIIIPSDPSPTLPVPVSESEQELYAAEAIETKIEVPEEIPHAPATTEVDIGVPKEASQTLSVNETEIEKAETIETLPSLITPSTAGPIIDPELKLEILPTNDTGKIMPNEAYMSLPSQELRTYKVDKVDTTSTFNSHQFNTPLMPNVNQISTPEPPQVSDYMQADDTEAALDLDDDGNYDMSGLFEEVQIIENQPSTNQFQPPHDPLPDDVRMSTEHDTQTGHHLRSHTSAPEPPLDSQMEDLPIFNPGISSTLQVHNDQQGQVFQPQIQGAQDLDISSFDVEGLDFEIPHDLDFELPDLELLDMQLPGVQGENYQSWGTQDSNVQHDVSLIQNPQPGFLTPVNGQDSMEVEREKSSTPAPHSGDTLPVMTSFTPQVAETMMEDNMAWSADDSTTLPQPIHTLQPTNAAQPTNVSHTTPPSGHIAPVPDLKPEPGSIELELDEEVSNKIERLAGSYRSITDESNNRQTPAEALNHQIEATSRHTSPESKATMDDQRQADKMQRPAGEESQIFPEQVVNTITVTEAPIPPASPALSVASSSAAGFSVADLEAVALQPQASCPSPPDLGERIIMKALNLRDAESEVSDEDESDVDSELERMMDEAHEEEQQKEEAQRKALAKYRADVAERERQEAEDWVELSDANLAEAQGAAATSLHPKPQGGFDFAMPGSGKSLFGTRVLETQEGTVNLNEERVIIPKEEQMIGPDEQPTVTPDEIRTIILNEDRKIAPLRKRRVFAGQTTEIEQQVLQENQKFIPGKEKELRDEENRKKAEEERLLQEKKEEELRIKEEKIKEEQEAKKREEAFLARQNIEAAYRAQREGLLSGRRSMPRIDDAPPATLLRQFIVSNESEPKGKFVPTPRTPLTPRSPSTPGTPQSKAASPVSSSNSPSPTGDAKPKPLPPRRTNYVSSPLIPPKRPTPKKSS